MNETEIKELLAHNLKKIRKEKNISQMELAEKIDRSVTFISELEQGKKGFSTKTLAKLSTFLEIEPSLLFLPKDYVPVEDKNISNMLKSIKDYINATEYRYKINLDNKNSKQKKNNKTSV